MLDEELLARGFKKGKASYVRARGDLVDVVDAQKDKSRTKVTLNFGVFVPASHELIWGEPLEKIEEPFCAVRARVGAIVGDSDIWWDIGHPESLGEAKRLLIERGIPFLEEFQDLSGIALHLENSDAIRRYGQVAKLQLISILFLSGRVTDAQSVAQTEIPLIPGTWKQRALALVERIGISASA